MLAINAWAGQLEDLGSRMLTVGSDTLITDPIPDELKILGWDDETSVCDARRRLNYYRKTPDNRLVFGKGGAGATRGGDGASAMWGPATGIGELKRHLARLFPTLAHAPVDMAWTAPVEYSLSGLPFAGWLRSVPGVCYGTGYSGDGVGPSRLMAKVLASLALGTKDEWSQSAFARVPRGWIPPDPLRYTGYQAVVSALKVVEARDDQGRRVPARLRRLVDVDPSTFAW